MNTLTETIRPLIVVLSSILLAMVLTSCSDDETTHNKFDHPHADKIDLQKHLFEHEFAEQCIAQKIANLTDKKTGRERFAQPCLCIATYLFKDLEAKESYALYNDKKHAQSLRKKYKVASKHCF